MIKILWEYRNPTNEERYEALMRGTYAKKQRVNLRIVEIDD